MIGKLLGLFTGVNPALLAKVLCWVLALLALESPAIYLFITRAQVEHQLSSVTQKYDVDEQSIGSLRAALATSQADLVASQKAAQEASDSVASFKARSDAAMAAASKAQSDAASARKSLQSLAAKRAQQVAAPNAAKESCDAALADLRAGR
jgi:chromosome segregation ATPase